MCDRCSHSHFHALHLNNSPRADNPCTLDHLHGTAEPGKFRLLPSVGLRATAAPIAPGHSWNSHLLSRTCISFFHCMLCPFPLCKHVLLNARPSPQRLAPQLDMNGSRPSRGAQLQISSSGTSAAIVSVQESQRPPLVVTSSQQRHHMCSQLQHQAGNAGIC